VDQRQAEELGLALNAQYEALEVEILDGGQPHYPLLIAVE
jgi:dihydroxyacetone kinase-like predicted kinase